MPPNESLFLIREGDGIYSMRPTEEPPSIRSLAEDFQ